MRSVLLKIVLDHPGNDTMTYNSHSAQKTCSIQNCYKTLGKSTKLALLLQALQTHLETTEALA